MSELKELPFEQESDPFLKDQLEPGFYNRIISTEQMQKDVTPSFIKTGIHNCFACNNKKYKKPLELSNFQASVMVVGEVPSDVSFQTKEGKLLIDTLTWAQFQLNDLYFTSLSKCEETVTPEQCQHHLLSEILCVRPKMILFLGYEVGKYFDSTIDRAGYTSTFIQQYPILVTYGVKYAMANETLFQEFCSHVLQAKQRMDAS